MSEMIYVLTIIYVGFVVNEIEGDRIAAFMTDVLHIDLSHWQKTYTNLRSRLFQAVNIKTASPAA